MYWNFLHFTQNIRLFALYQFSLVSVLCSAKYKSKQGRNVNVKIGGIIGGVSWHSTKQIYEFVNTKVAAQKGRHNCAELVLVNVNLENMISTSLPLPFNTMISRLTSDEQQRVQLTQADGIGQILSQWMVVSLTFTFVGWLGGGDSRKGFLYVGISFLRENHFSLDIIRLNMKKGDRLSVCFYPRLCRLLCGQ